MTLTPQQMKLLEERAKTMEAWINRPAPTTTQKENRNG